MAVTTGLSQLSLFPHFTDVSHLAARSGVRLPPVAVAESYAYALRAKKAGVAICRFDLPGAGHFMLGRIGDWNALVRRFVVGVTGVEPLHAAIANALRGTR